MKLFQCEIETFVGYLDLAKTGALILICEQSHRLGITAGMLAPVLGTGTRQRRHPWRSMPAAELNGVQEQRPSVHLSQAPAKT